MPKAISYIRFSSGKQATGNSYQRQQEAFTRWLIANTHYSRSDLKYEDLGKSGFEGQHIKDGGGWAKLLEGVKSGLIKAGDCCVVEAIDRTGRLETMDMLTKVITPILEAGVSIITLDDNVTYTKKTLNTPVIHLLLAKIQAAFNYSQSLSDRIRDGYGIRRENAKNGNGVKRYTPVWLTSDGKVKKDIAPYIRNVFDWYISGIGKHAIASRLRATGVTEFETCTGTTVLKWLKNKTAIGYWGDIPGVYLNVVTPEIFQLAQNRQRDVQTSPKTYTSKNLLVGLVRCGTCGGGYGIVRKHGKPHSMRCNRLQRVDDCTNKQNIPYAVIRYIFSLTARHWLGRALQKTQLSINGKQKLVIEAEINDLSSRIDKIVDVIDMVEDNVELKYKLKSLHERRKPLIDELEILSRTVDSNSDWHDVSLAESDLLLNDPVRLNSMLKMTGYTLTVHPGNLVTAAEELYPWLYVGVKRSGNATAGYRIHYLGTETVIRPDVPETPDWGQPTDNVNEKIRYMMRKEHKPLAIFQPVDWVDLKD